MSSSEQPQVRRYTLSFEVEVRAQDDFAHFQPNSVVASVPALGFEWVSGNDTEALRDFFAFFLRGEYVEDWETFRAGQHNIVASAMDSKS